MGNFSSLHKILVALENFEKCTVAMLGGPCSQHVMGNTSRLYQPESAIMFVNTLLLICFHLFEAILNRIDTHSMEGFASAVKHHLISKYGLECQNESCYVYQRQPRSWCVNRLLPVNHYVHIPPFIDTLFLTAHSVHYYNMTVWILAGNYISYYHNSGLD